MFWVVRGFVVAFPALNSETRRMTAESPPLAERTCVPCPDGTPPLDASAIEPLLAQLDGWEVHDSHHLEKNYTFDNFVDALAFVNRVGSVAEESQHHPDIYFTWGKAKLRIFSHNIDGLAEADFVLAAKCDKLR